MYKDLFEPVREAVDALSAVAASFFGAPDTLREPPTDGTVKLPDALFAQGDVQTEWWYYTGHCRSTEGREFGFELVFFKRRTDRDRIGGVPVSAIGNPMYFAHFAISDIRQQRFRYDHIRSFNTPVETAVTMSERSCDISFGEWSLREVAGKHILHATLKDGLVFDAVLEATKPVVLNGAGGSGITQKKAGASNHFSFTRMKVDGQLVDGGRLEQFTGSAWMDREYGSWEQGGWDWFSIQFDDDTELMLYQFADPKGGMRGASTGTYVGKDGECIYLERSDFEIESTSTWTSSRTGATYPAGWRVKVPRLDIDVEITPLIDDQELDTRGTTMIVYWEGVSAVSGQKGGQTSTGRAYVELVGYDRSHESVGLVSFLFGRTLQNVRDLV